MRGSSGPAACHARTDPPTTSRFGRPATLDSRPVLLELAAGPEVHGEMATDAEASAPWTDGPPIGSGTGRRDPIS